jgi:hypothetical protein
MRADSLRGRIIGALARVSSGASPSARQISSPEAPTSDAQLTIVFAGQQPPASSPTGLLGRTEYEHTMASRHLPRLQRSSAAGRIVAAVARSETAGPTALYTPSAKKTPKPVAVSSPSFLRESALDEWPTLAALLWISLDPT